MIIKGQRINDRYQIIRNIGEGGMANVYLAFDTILERNVAVKVLRGDLANDEKFVRRFQREAISASSLTHPSIVEMYDVGEDSGKYFIVMEYIDGKTLKSLIKKRGPLTLPEVIDIMLQLTSAISCAHSSYIIHRDIKPQNVMILDDGRAKITDFGIAIASNATDITQTNSVMGSVHYLPPEQANGNGATIKSDVYSLGILMYELLIGKVPFKGDNAVEIALKQMKEQIPSVCEQNPDIPQSLENIIIKACAKNPKNRYDSVSEMHEDLKTALSRDRADEKKLEYLYPEYELEDTKPVSDLSRISKNSDNLEDTEGFEKNKKINLFLLITGGIFTLLTILITLFVFIIPALNKPKEIKIPDVSGLTVTSAEKKLKAAGLTVEVELVEEASEDIKKDKVIKTQPAAGRTVKEGTKITLVVSIGPDTVLIENYVGENSLEIKGKLEAKGLKVEIEYKELTDEKDKDKKQLNRILEQNPTPGSKLEKGETVTLIVPLIVTEYPDFKAEGYTVDTIRKFCNDYEITLVIEELATTDYAAGTIISQSRAPKSRVEKYAELKIVVAKAPATESIPNPDDSNPTG